MRPPSVRPYQPADLPACAALLAGKHRRARQRQAMLPERFEDTAACEEALGTFLEAGAEVWVAERDGAPVGYLGGTRSMPAPGSFGAQYGASRGISVPDAGHALAEDEPPTETYRALYGAAAEHWADDGFFNHTVTVRPADAEAREAWFMLGFGANVTFCTRDTSPLGPSSNGERAGIEVHAASLEELSLVRHFDELEALHHRASPIMWPFMAREVAAAVEAFQRASLEGEENRIFLATREGQPLAMHFVIRKDGGFGAPISRPDNSVYLYQAIVEPGARSEGVGTALLSHTLDWARGEGFEWLNLHYASMNPSGAPFWQRHGFEPLEISVQRRLDERIAWARQR